MKDETGNALVLASPRGVVPRSIDDLARVGTMAVASGFFKNLKSAAEASAKVQMGLELGIGPMQALSSIHVVDGKPTLSANLVAALADRAGYDLITEWQGEPPHVTGCTVIIEKNGRERGRGWFTVEDAQRAGLMGKQVWKSYLSDMLWARAVMRAVRRGCPGVAIGVYDPDELSEEPAQRIEPVRPKRTPTPRQIQPPQPEAIDAEFSEAPAPAPAPRNGNGNHRPPSPPKADSHEDVLAQEIPGWDAPHPNGPEEVPTTELPAVDDGKHPSPSWNRANRSCRGALTGADWSDETRKAWMDRLFGVRSSTELTARQLELLKEAVEQATEPPQEAEFEAKALAPQDATAEVLRASLRQEWQKISPWGRLLCGKRIMEKEAMETGA